jgi:phosphopantothenoylcysteine decarboxylase/phosphopantothenate--cysteine ligase
MPGQAMGFAVIYPDSGIDSTMSNLPFKKILLGVTGGIAAYKSPDLVRRLRELGAEVQVVMTPSAEKLVSTTVFQAVSGREVRGDLWDEEAEAAMGHIELARWADLVLVAPATANTMSQLAAGTAGGLLTTLCLATEAPLVLAPAMNQAMWRHPATQHNREILGQRGVRIIGPAEGEQACGDVGPGRMAEPNDIVSELCASFGASTGQLEGITLVVTAGPTREPIDPVRYVSNRSSGKMGFAVAAAAAAAGARVTLVAGPVNLPTPPGVERLDVFGLLPMLQRCEGPLLLLPAC